VAIDRLGQEVVGPRLQAVVAILLAGHGGHQQDRQVFPTRLGPGLQLATSLVAIDLWHHDVEQHQIDRLSFDQGQPLPGALCLQQHVASPKTLPDERAVAGVVIDQQDNRLFWFQRRLQSPNTNLTCAT